jgi:hypothetical protein
MTKNGLDIQTISTNRTDKQADRVLLCRQVTIGKEKANASQNQKSRFLQRLIIIIQDEVLCYHSNISKPNRLAH